MNLRAAKKIRYSQSSWVTGVSMLLVFYSILFYSILFYSILFYSIPFYVYITDTNIISLDKQSSLADSL
jgi:hypothetical protein